ncbi:zf-HC2 domain-containing protein [Aeromicrobium sp. Leaf350]|uniref:zf-HC2 domain-containing protein n=1 Tax=Aeromicrobium sp. Leaf350 TaxID=2876565 RepID=UPI001E65780B|nr:zf-HC2 domain-containing protein [Aeromicrobium sp. Leaf350]
MTSDPHALLGAYALGSLGELENARFASHLRGCHECLAELVSFAATSAALDDLDL